MRLGVDPQQLDAVAAAMDRSGATLDAVARALDAWLKERPPSDHSAVAAWLQQVAATELAAVNVTTPDDFDTAANVYDFVCWGTNPHASHKATAEAATVPKWTGACAGAITGDAIARKSNVDGVDAADYDINATASPLTCP